MFGAGSGEWRERTFGWLRGLVPAFVRYLATLVLFWPTVLKMRIEAYLRNGSSRRVWDRVPDSPLVVGQVPVLRADVEALHALGVRSVVNLCREWNANEETSSFGVEGTITPSINSRTALKTPRASMPCSILNACCFSRRRLVSPIARDIESVIRSA